MALSMTPDQLCAEAVALGARAAKRISVRSVKTGTWVRLKCQYGCGGYGQRRTCPPFSPSPEVTKKMLQEYAIGILIHGDLYTSISDVGVAIEKKAFLSGYYKAFAFLSGPCRHCADCDPQKPCENPDQARPAMEASGIDVFATARANGFPIEVVVSTEDPQNYYSLVLLE